LSEIISTTLNAGITLTVAVTITATGAVVDQSDGPAIADGAGAGTLVNDGMIQSGGLSSIYLAYGGNIDNQLNGNISGVEALDILRAGRVTNQGTIAGGFLGIYLNAGVVYNRAHGLIDGGVAMNAGTVVNQGDMSSGNGADIAIHEGGVVMNLGTNATITGVGATGVDISGGAGLVVNQGLIDSVSLLGGGTVENSGYLGAATDSYGLVATGALTSVQNSGFIIAASFASQASFTNTSAGVVSGYEDGIFLAYGGNISNDGTIFGLGGKSGILLGTLKSPPPGLSGVAMSNGGVLLNGAASAVIYGRQDGVTLTGSHGTYLTNDGTIIGDIGINNAGDGSLLVYDSGTITGLNGTAIDFGAGLGRLVLEGNGQINGAVIGYNPDDQVIFARGGNQTLTGLSAQFLNVMNFNNTGADLVFSGAAALAPGATLTNGATIEADGALDSLGTIINNGTIIGPLILGGVYPPTAPVNDAIMLSNAGSGSILSAQAMAIEQINGGAAATIINAGLIADTAIGGVAVSFTGDLDNLLILDTGSTMTGLVEGGSTPGARTGSVLKLADGSRTGTISGIGTQYTGFATVELAAGAAWEVEASTGAILAGAGADIIIDGAAPASETIDLAGAGANLTLGDAAAFAGVIANFGASQTIDIATLQYDAADQATLAPGDILDIIADGETFALQLDPTGNYEGDQFHLSDNGANGTDITEGVVACFLRGTPIRTPRGDVPIEALRIGDLVAGADGEDLPVKWIGRRSYGAAQLRDPDIQPILIRKDAVADNVPDRDLFLSPCHAILVEGLHIPTGALVNGVSILPAAGLEKIEYFHIETEHHTSIIACNTPVETFIDDDSRRLFDNAAEFYRLYPERPGKPVCFGVPRLESGSRLEALRRSFAARAGVRADAGEAGPITGFLESADRETITGWAYNHASPNTPVLLDILNRGAVIARVLANAPRPDVKRAGFGSGRCGFSLTLPAPLPAFQRHEISVRPAGTAAPLSGSPVVLDPGFVHDLVKVGALRQMVQAAVKSLSAPQDIHDLEADLEFSAGLVRSIRAESSAAQAASKPGRPTVLMIDENWPTPTRDAGSNAIISHAQALNALGYNVAYCAASGAPRTPLQAAGILALKQMGVVCHGQDGVATEEVIKRLARQGLELVYLHRMAIAVSYAGLVKQHAPACRIIYAVADLHHVRFSRQAAITGRPDVAEAAKRARATEFWAMRMADHVLTHSAKEAAYLRHAAPNISAHVVPWSVLPHSRLRNRMDRPDIAFLGGADHAPNVDAVLHLAHDILPAIWQHHPELRCLVIGEGWPPAIFGGLDPRLQVIGHHPNLSDAFQTVRLTVAPLRFGAGLKGKVLESFAAGLPCVMSPIAAEGFDLDAQLQTAIAPSADFADTLLNIYQDAAHQLRLARSGRTMLSRNFSPDAVTASFSTMLGLAAHPAEAKPQRAFA
jgi:glycosyltransferase involved in cell wall biosynthesis